MNIAIDIGGTSIKLAVVTRDGEIIEKSNVLISNCKTEESFTALLLDSIERIFTKFPKDDFSGIGVAAPICLPEKGMIVKPSNLPIEHEFPLQHILENHFSLPTSLVKDSTAFLLGEKKFGKAQDLSDFAMVTLGTGLGSAVMVNNQVVNGASGFGSEWGHSIAILNGRACSCDRRGCLETYVSAKGICRTVAELIAETNLKSELRNIPPQYLTAHDVYVAAKEEDALALAAFDKTAFYLGNKLSDFVLTFSPKVIFLSGGVSQSREFLINPTQEYMDTNLLEQFKGITKLSISGLPKSDAALLGAASTISEITKKSFV